MQQFGLTFNHNVVLQQERQKYLTLPIWDEHVYLWSSWDSCGVYSP